MAKIDLKFLCVDDENSFISVVKTDYYDPVGSEDIFITLRDEEQGQESYIWLDVSTAIKFAKTIRTEINKIKEI
tara:strand:+ start:2333 stop:2554 length:222 start_codon:yes stop_codon:yes gene_type:complete